MRLSPNDLKVVRAGGLVTRYAVMGDGVFVIAEIPHQGSSGARHRGRVQCRALGIGPPG